MKTANAAELTTVTKPFAVAVGAESWSAPRTDLAGIRIKSPNAPAIYLIDPDGYRRWIPDPDTYNNLFRDWNGIVVDIDVVSIPEGAPLTSGAVLARPSNAAPVYLVSNGQKRW